MLTSPISFSTIPTSHSDIGCRRCFSTHWSLHPLCTFGDARSLHPFRCCRESVPISGYARPLHPFPVLQGSLHPLCTFGDAMSLHPLSAMQGLCTHSGAAGSLHPFTVLQGRLYPFQVMQGLCTHSRCCKVSAPIQR